MVAPGRTLTKSQKRELRSWLSKSGFDGRPELLLSNPEHAWAAWMDYQASKGIAMPALNAPVTPVAPAPAPAPFVERVVRRGRGSGKVPAGELYSIRLSPALLASLRDRALAEARPLSEIIRLALRAYLATPSRLGSPEAVPAGLPEGS